MTHLMISQAPEAQKGNKFVVICPVGGDTFGVWRVEVLATGGTVTKAADPTCQLTHWYVKDLGPEAPGAINIANAKAVAQGTGLPTVWGTAN